MQISAYHLRNLAVCVAYPTELLNFSTDQKEILECLLCLKISRSIRNLDYIVMRITKSTRHSKIAGNFGETVVLYWLSKYGFECALVDHTGIDIIARNPHTQELMGISVKSRTRSKGGEGESVTIPNKNLNKANDACRAFRCVPYFAIVVDAGDAIRGYILSMEHLLKIHPKGKRASEWKMGKAYINKYSKDKQIKSFVFKTKTTNWWSSK